MKKIEVTFAILGLIFIVGCGKKPVNQAHIRLTELSSVDDDREACRELRRQQLNAYGYYDEALEEWVYPRTIDRARVEEALRRCEEEYGRSLGYRTKITEILLDISEKRMSEEEKTVYVMRRFHLRNADLLEIKRSGRVPNRVIVQIRQELDCSNAEAEQLISVLILK